MSSAAPLLTRYADKRILAPGYGITCPQELLAELTANRFDVDDTVTDGQCGLHAFLIALTLAKRQWPRLQQLAAYKNLVKMRPLQSKLEHLRLMAVTWLKENAHTALWEGMTVKAFVENCMCDECASFGDYLEKMSQRYFWVDIAMLHALGVLFKVDVVIFQYGSDISFVGATLQFQATAEGHRQANKFSTPRTSALPLIPVALHNDRHYWGLTPSCNSADVCGTRGADADADADADAHSDAHAGATCQPSDMSYEDVCESYVEVQAISPQPQEAVQRELSLCLALCKWDPFAEPQQELLDSMAAIIDSPADATTCAVRQKAVDDLLYESANYDAIPERMRYHGASRWRLSSRRLAVDAQERPAFVQEYLQVTSKISLQTIAKDLQPPLR